MAPPRKALSVVQNSAAELEGSPNSGLDAPNIAKLEAGGDGSKPEASLIANGTASLHTGGDRPDCQSPMVAIDPRPEDSKATSVAGNHPSKSDKKTMSDEPNHSNDVPTNGDGSVPKEPTRTNQGVEGPGQSSGQDSNKIDKQSKEYIDFLEARLEVVEKELRAVTKAGASVDKVNDEPADDHDAAEPQILRVRPEKWREVKPTLSVISGQPPLLVSLNEPKHEFRRRYEINAEERDVDSLSEPPRQGSVASTPPDIPYRLALNSYSLIDALKECTGEILPDSQNVLVRPFKFLLMHDARIRIALDEYQSKCIEQGDHAPVPGQEKADATKGRGDEGITSPSQGNKEEVNVPPVIVHLDSSKPSANSMTENPATAPNPPTSETTIVELGSDTNMKAKTDPGKKTSVKDKQLEIKQERRTRDALRLLVEFMENDMKDIYSIRGQIANATLQDIQFEYLWLLFNPGDVVFGQSSDDMHRRAYRVLHVTGGRAVLDSENRTAPLQGLNPHHAREPWEQEEDDEKEMAGISTTVTALVVDCFYIDFDGEKLGPRPKRFTIPSYGGKRPILSLDIFPAAFTPQQAQARARLVRRGRRFAELATKSHKRYSGLTLLEGTQFKVQEEVNSDVVLDQAAGYESLRKRNPDATTSFSMHFGDGIIRTPTKADRREVFEVAPCGIPACMSCTDIYDDSKLDRDRRSTFIQHTNLLGYSTIKNATDDQLELLPFRLYGYVLQDHEWHALNVNSVSELQEDTNQLQSTKTAFENLVLPHAHKVTIQALVKNQTRSFSQVSRIDRARSEINLGSDVSMDLVRGKGRGLIILLHGVPGVGKTSTAECVAAELNRPLFPVTCGDLGTDVRPVEQRLNEYFRLAQRWGCVLLLDEADVFMAKRQPGDLKRNGLVSVFMRALEYYAGVLILTTNRVGEFDEAFRSRVHISLYYPKLDKKSTTKIWNMNLQRIINARDFDIDVEEDDIRAFAAKHWADSKNKPTRRWNGWQIKNAFQTALALANSEFYDMANGANLKRPMLKAEHFEHVAKTSEHFDDYVNELHIGDEPADVWSVLAERSHLRKDDYPAMDPSTVSGKHARSRKAMPLKGGTEKRRMAYVESEDSDNDSDDDSDLEVHKLKLKLAKMEKKKRESKKARPIKIEESEDDDSS